VTLLPDRYVESFHAQLNVLRVQHDRDVEIDLGEVYLLHVLGVKLHPSAVVPVRCFLCVIPPRQPQNDCTNPAPHTTLNGLSVWSLITCCDPKTTPHWVSLHTSERQGGEIGPTQTTRVCIAPTGFC